MNNHSKIRKIVQGIIFNEEVGVPLNKEWEDYYRELSNMANKYLDKINLVLDESALSAEEKNEKIRTLYRIYLSSKRVLKPAM